MVIYLLPSLDIILSSRDDAKAKSTLESCRKQKNWEERVQWNQKKTNTYVPVTSHELRKKKPTDSKCHTVEMLKMNQVLWSQAGRKWETPRHQEKMLIIRCTVSGHCHDLFAEQDTAWCSSDSRSIVHSQSLVYVPPLQRSKRAEPADNGQARLLCTMSLCPSSLQESAGCVKILGYFFQCSFVTNHFPCDFLESRASRTEEDFPCWNWFSTFT